MDIGLSIIDLFTFRIRTDRLNPRGFDFMDDKKNKKELLDRREFIATTAAVGVSALLAPAQGRGQFIPFNFLQKKSGTVSILQTIPGTVETPGAANASSASYYLLVDTSNNQVIFTTGNRVNSSSSLYTLPRYLQASNSLNLTLGRSGSATLYCIGGGGDGGGSPAYGCGHGGSSGWIYVATCSVTNGETVTVEAGVRNFLKSSAHSSEPCSGVSPYRSYIYFSASKYLQSSSGGSHDFANAYAAYGNSAGITITSGYYNVSYTGYGYCSDDYYYSQSGTSGDGYVFLGCYFGRPGQYYRNAGTDGMICIKIT